MIKVKNNKGFTLIELLVAVVIITILSSVVLTNLSVHRQKARDARRVSELNQLKDAVELYFQEKGKLPNCIYPENCAVTDPDKNYIKNLFQGQMPFDPSNGDDYYYLVLVTGPGSPKRYCLGAEVENIQPTAPCAQELEGDYIIQGP